MTPEEANVSRLYLTKPGSFPNYLVLKGTIREGSFILPCKYEESYQDEEGKVRHLTIAYPYSFDFIYKERLGGTVYIYQGGFSIILNNAYPPISHFPRSENGNSSISYYPNFLENGSFTQSFIDNFCERLEADYQYNVGNELRGLHKKRILSLSEEMIIQLSAHAKESAKYGGTHAYKVAGMQSMFEKWLKQFKEL